MSESRPKRVLVVDDEIDVTELVSYHLRSRGLEVQTVNDPTGSLAAARAFRPDLVVLDVMMPDLNGFQICRLLRADPALARIPVIFLTARAEESDRIQGLETGADDYVVKPFSVRELGLRIQGILRRADGVGDAATPRVLRAGSIELDIDRHEVRVQGGSVDLTATEFKLLRLLLERRGRVQTREHLLLNVWNYETEIETRTVDTHVRRLREKLGAEADWIETIRGVGYRLAERRAGEAAPVRPHS